MAAARRPDEHPAAPTGGDAAERRKQLKARNWALLAALVAFAVLVYVVAIVRMSGG